MDGKLGAVVFVGGAALGAMATFLIENTANLPATNANVEANRDDIGEIEDEASRSVYYLLEEMGRRDTKVEKMIERLDDRMSRDAERNHGELAMIRDLLLKHLQDEHTRKEP